MTQKKTLPDICLRLSIVALALLPLSALCVRWHWLHFRWGLLLFALSALLGLAVIATAALTTRRQKLAESRKRLSHAALLAAPPVLFFMLNLFAGAGAPLIHDVSTDTLNPPRFEAAVEQRQAGDNTPEYNADIAALQRTAYPDLKPLAAELPPAQAIEVAKEVAEELGWEVYAYEPARARLEAVDTTRWFGFQDDIVIRITASAGGSTVDLRSASRVGQGDLGANARRIERFMTKFSQFAEQMAATSAN